MIKAILFDLDGVLIDTKEIHYKALNEALGKDFEISLEDHLNIYDGLKTSQKLDLLSTNKGLPKESHKRIWKDKQDLTMKLLNGVKVSEDLVKTFEELQKNYKIACCSNAIRKTVLYILSKLGIIQFFDIIISNEDVSNGKPHPEMYWKAMSSLSVLPEETLIVEDSPYGILAANRSNSRVMRVKDSSQVTYNNIIDTIKNVEKGFNMSVKWVDKKLNVLIPMAGAGTRFEQAGYIFPKPLIDINGKPMIQLVVENLNIDANYIFVVQKKHREKYCLDSLLNLVVPNCTIVETNGVTEGAACTALLAKEYINSDNPLFFANSDQFVEWDSLEFLYKMQETKVDGGIVTFKAIHPKWSFVKKDSYGFATEVAEKKPISDNATVGYYYWKKGSDFVKYAEQMIEKNIRVNNEFYVCPVFNEAIGDSKKISTYEAKKMWGLGTPEDLNVFLRDYV